MDDWSSLYNLSNSYSAYQGGATTWYAIGAVLALIGAVIVAIVFIRSENRVYYTGWMKRVSVHVNFERYIIPLILKFLYVFSVLAVIINGIITIFTTSFWMGLMMAVLGPIAVRLVYELIMMLFSIRDGIMETNRLLQNGVGPARRAASRPPQAPQAPQQEYAVPSYPPQQPADTAEERHEPPKHYPGGYDPMRR